MTIFFEDSSNILNRKEDEQRVEIHAYYVKNLIGPSQITMIRSIPLTLFWKSKDSIV